MLTDEQQEFRLTGLGGSDIGTLWGLNPYAQQIDLFYSKRPDLADAHGYQPREVESFAVDRGNVFEEPVAQLVEKRLGVKLRKSNVQHRHPKHDWLIANIDRKVHGSRTVTEIKTVSHHLARQWGPEGTDEVAEYYLPQPHHYMLVLDYPAAQVVAMIGMDDLRIYDLQRDPEMDDLIIETTHDFWHRHVLKGEPPEIDADHKAATDVLKRTYHLVNDEAITLPDESAHWHAVMQQAQAIRKEQDAIIEGAKNHLQRLMGNAGRAYIPGVKGAYARQQRKRAGFTVEPTEYVEFKYSARMK